MATIKDIAKHVGVSTMTVSNVLHRRFHRVSPETAKKVQEAAKELGYRPNLHARSLVSKNSRVIAYVSTPGASASGRFAADPFHAGLTDEMETRLGAAGYYLMLKSLSKASELTEFLQNWQPEGVFLVGIDDGGILSAALSSGVPAVCIDCPFQPGLISIGLDDYAGGRLAAQHLLQKGHRRLAFAMPHGGSIDSARLSGFSDELASQGISLPKERIFDVSLWGVEAVAGALCADPGTTAIFATADILAAQLISAITARGARVPQDVSVLGFDDSFLCQLTYPALSSIHQDVSRRAGAAADAMFRLLMAEQAESVKLPVSLSERDSVIVR